MLPLIGPSTRYSFYDGYSLSSIESWDGRTAEGVWMKAMKKPLVLRRPHDEMRRPPFRRGQRNSHGTVKELRRNEVDAEKEAERRKADPGSTNRDPNPSPTSASNPQQLRGRANPVRPRSSFVPG